MENNLPLSERGRIAYQKGYEAGADKAREDADRFLAEMLPLSARQRRERLREVKREHAALMRKIAVADRDRGQWERILEVYEGLSPWFKELDDSGHVFAKPDATSLHHLSEDMRCGRVFNLFERHKVITNHKEFADTLESTELFCVEHDWAAAFKNARDFEGSFRLPYDNCCFEFRINGRTLLVLGANYTEVADEENVVILQTFYRGAGGWVADAARWHGDGVEDFQHPADDVRDSNAHLACLAQIKAVCIALDASVAESTPVRAAPGLVKARLKNRKIPPKDHHIVCLANRHRAERLPGTGEPKYHVRLHFRRGHWRHFTTHRTWIKWMLVGDPDLGFVDKHYRL